MVNIHISRRDVKLLGKKILDLGATSLLDLAGMRGGEYIAFLCKSLASVENLIAL